MARSKKAVARSSRSLRSVNVVRDATGKNRVASYLITPTAVRTLESILGELCEHRGGAWTLTGPFGTGKSAFVLFLSQLLNASDANIRKHAASLLMESVHGRGHAETWIGSSAPRYIPVLCVGSREPLGVGLIRSLSAAVVSSRHKLPAKLASTLQTAERKAKAGTAPESQILVDLVEGIAESVAKSRGCASGLLLVIDELGKSLEFAAAQPEATDIFVLQQLAEMASRTNGSVALIGVLHQDFRAYVHGLPPADRAEWEKIRGRFEDIIFEEPAEQLLRFIAMAWTAIRSDHGFSPTKAAVRATRAAATRLWEHGLAPQGLRMKGDGELLEAAAPMHPLVASLLGPLFRRFAQNERSAFAFLQSEEPSGLLAFCRRSSSSEHCLFDVVDLYDHLRASLGAMLLHTPDAKRWAEAFETEARLPSLSSDSTEVLRAVALLSVVSRWYPVPASREVLAFALSDRLSGQRIDAAIDELKAARAIVHRKYNDSFVIWEGSDVDVSARLEEAHARIGRSSAAAALLRAHARLHPLLARRHSFERGTLRFFDITFESWDEEAPDYKIEHDGRLVVLLGAAKRGRSKRTKGGPRTLFCVPMDAGRLDELALELAAIEWVCENTDALNSDSAARRELHARRLEVERLLDLTLDRLLRAGSATCKWYLDGVTVEVVGPRALNELLSRICDDVFSETPPIDCELLNRHELSSSAASARNKLLEAMIDKPNEIELGLVDGDPPERSMYRSVLSSQGGLGLHVTSRNGKSGFFRPKLKDGDAVYRVLDDLIDEAGDERIELKRLFSALAAPPFGLRNGVVPVLVFAYLLANESDLAIYDDGRFCREWSTALAAQAIKSPIQLSVRRLQVKGVRARVFKELATALALSEDPANASDKVLAAVRPLMRFVALLPEHARLTTNLSEQTIKVRDALTGATEPETLLFTDLPKACELKPFGSGGRGRGADVVLFVDAVKDSITELRDTLPTLLSECEDTIQTAFGLPDDESAFRELLTRAEKVSEWAVESDMKLLVQRVIAGGASPDETAFGVASLMAERPVDKWRDEDRSKFAVRLKQFARRFAMLESTVTEHAPSKAGRRSAIRLALVSANGTQIDRTVRLSAAQHKRASAIEGKLRKSLTKESDSTVIMAALCGLLAELDNEELSVAKEVKA